MDETERKRSSINSYANCCSMFLQYTSKSELFNFYELGKIDTSTFDIFEALLRNSDLLYALKEFSNLVERSVKDRVLQTPPKCENCLYERNYCNHAKIAILFSGGIDCSVLAAISSKYVDEDDPIDLINVAFQKVGVFGETSWDVPDRISAKTSLLELKKLYPRRFTSIHRPIFVSSCLWVVCAGHKHPSPVLLYEYIASAWKNVQKFQESL